jgi:hypothetical protein
MKYFAIIYLKIFVLSFFLFLVTYSAKAQITSFPHTEDFENGWGGWTIAWNTTSSWEWGTPSSTGIINSASSGTNAWVTNLDGDYDNFEDGYLLSPVFDLSSLTNATVEFDLWWNCEYEYDGLVLQSSIDEQLSWQNVGTVGSGTNWYNFFGIRSNPGNQLAGEAEGWSGRAISANGSNGWVTVSHEINHLIGQPNVLFRLFFASDFSVVDEGIGFDLFKINTECDLNTINSAQDLIVVYDGTGNQIEVDSWLANNGGALVDAPCGDVTWSYEIISDDLFEDTLSVFIQFTAEDSFGNQAFASAFITYEQFAFAGESTGTNGFLCGIDSYNLGLITGLDPNDTKFQNSNFSTTQFDGPPGTNISGLDVEFPDTGAGQFAYAFRVEIETEITIGNSDPLQYNSEAFLTVNNVTIPFDPGEDKTIFVCDASNVDLTALYDELDILVDVDESGFSFVTSDDFFPEDYWFDLDDNSISEITEAGTYKFNPRAFLPECGAEVTLVTIIEEEQLDAGNDVLDAVDDSSYLCGDTVSFDLNIYLDDLADSGGRWYDSNDVELTSSVVEFPDTGAGNFTKSFKYRQENEVCGFFSEADYEVTYDVAEFSVGTSTTFNICAGITVTEQDLIDELGADSGGFWSPNIDDSLNVQPGVYFYSQGDCGVSGDSQIELIATNCSTTISAKLFLQGASINPNIGQESLMRDDLRIGGLIPTISPYTDALSCDSSVFNTGGSSGTGLIDDDIVDWVFVELRDSNDATSILYSRSAFLQRDGDIVAEDGISDVSILAAYDDYYLALKHRNHLGVISNSVITLNESTTITNFTDNSLMTLGTNSQVLLDSGFMALWAGDFNGDGQVRYLGPNNDTNFLKSIVINEPGNDTNSNFYPFSGYNNSDIDLNGQIRYLGPNNDTNILKFIVVGHPSNESLSNFFPFTSQIPE